MSSSSDVTSPPLNELLQPESFEETQNDQHSLILNSSTRVVYYGAISSSSGGAAFNGGGVTSSSGEALDGATSTVSSSFSESIVCSQHSADVDIRYCSTPLKLRLWQQLLLPGVTTSTTKGGLQNIIGWTTPLLPAAMGLLTIQVALH